MSLLVKQVIILPLQEIMVNFVYSRQQKTKPIFYLKDDNGKVWEEVIISAFLNAVATTLDVFPANN